MAKRFLALFVSLVMVFSFTMPAYAEGAVTDDGIVIENAEETDGQTPDNITEPDDDGDSFDAYEFNDVYDVGDDTEVIPCADCGNNPCTCKKEDTTSPCETCGNEPCICDVGEPVACEVCNQTPCICEQEQPGVTEPACPGDDTCTIEGCQNHTAPAPVQGCEECGATEDHAEDCSQNEFAAQNKIYDTLMAAESVEDMFLALLGFMNSDPEGLFALSSEELQELYDHAATLNEIAPSEDYTDLCDTLQYIAGEYELNGAVVLPSSLSAAGGTLASGEYVLSNNVQLTNNITIPANAVVTIDLAGYVLQGTGSGSVITVNEGATLTIKDSNPTLGHNGNITNEGLWEWVNGNYNDNSKGGFIYNKGTGQGITVKGTLNMEGGTIAGCKASLGPAITGTSSAKITITGGRIIYNCSTNTANSGGAIHSEKDHNNLGSFLDISNAEISNNTSHANGGAVYGYRVTLNNCTINGNKALNGAGVFACGGGTLTVRNCMISGNISQNRGGGLYVDSNGSAEIDASTIDGNYAGIDGGGIYSNSDIVVENSYVTNNRAMTTETATSSSSTRVNQGRGGGLYITGSTVESTITNSEITGNACMYYGGGVQVCNGAKLELKSGSKINYNEAILHGAGGVHVTEDATFTLTDGEISYNTAHSVGGAIHSSYSCTLNLNGGEISHNTVYGRGGGVHVNVGGNLLLNGTVISDNSAYNGDNRYAATVDDDLMNWSNIKSSGHVAGYGGGVVVDAGTCTMTAGSLSSNYAQTGGGGIAFVMINTAADKKFGENKVVSFDFQDGTIVNNWTSGNGAGIYLMENTFSETEIEEKCGWTIVGNNITDSKGEKITLTDASGTTVNIQDILTAIPYVKVSGGTIRNNIAYQNGGAAYLEENTKFYISDGSLTENEAVNGGAVYVAQGEAYISGGSITKNKASKDGGALYINGNVSMTGGTIGDANKGNIAAQNGGAVYITGGNMTINHGILNHNSATDGGAIYMDGDDDTTLYFQSGKMNNNNASDDGGAIYATGGTLYIGLKDCPGQTRDNNNNVIDENIAAHKHQDTTGFCQYHPQIQGNQAEDVGGGIALAGKDASSGELTEGPDGTLSGGKVHFYCGVANTNKALYKGVGLNVFMQGGEFHFYQGTNIGEPHDPDLVIIGGKLENHDDSTEYIYLYYYEDNVNQKDEPDFIGMAKMDSYMNLPEGEYFWMADQNEVFVGWTPFGPNATDGPDSVRDKDDYKQSGVSIRINDTVEMRNQQNTYDGTQDKIMNLYAIWAPKTSYITYMDSLTERESTTTPESGTTVYTLHKGATQTIIIPATNSNAHPGFAIVGWYLYQDEGQNANWCDANYNAYEPAYKGFLNYSNLIYNKTFGAGGMVYLPLSAPNADLELTVDPMTFGNITLVADYALVYGDLTISKSGTQAIDENQSFVFDVTSESLAADVFKGRINSTLAVYEELNALSAIDMQVVIEGDGSIVVKHLPLGTYEVTEDSNWSWRYTTADGGEVEVTANGGAINFANTRESNSKWLSGDSYCENWWDGTTIRRKDEYIDPTETKSD